MKGKVMLARYGRRCQRTATREIQEHEGYGYLKISAYRSAVEVDVMVEFGLKEGLSPSVLVTKGYMGS